MAYVAFCQVTKKHKCGAKAALPGKRYGYPQATPEDALRDLKKEVSAFKETQAGDPEVIDVVTQ